MNHGALTSYIDVAQIALYAFWIFFAGLIWYLRREDKREGYPLDSDRADASGGRVVVQGWPAIPQPKTFLMQDGSTVQTPRPDNDRRPIAARPVANFPGAALEPTGNPMLDGVGPAAYALRADVPDRLSNGDLAIVPLRVVPEIGISPRDPDPRGMTVAAADGDTAGRVVDAWIDRSEPQIRYLEVEVATSAGPRRVLLPSGFARYDFKQRIVNVPAITARQFADVPSIAHPDRVTRLEEDRICAYFAGGLLYAVPSRQEPLL
jgi:photosynthetic reaction center H subunit